MFEKNPMPLTEAMRAWHDFYSLLGTASATMVGLLFVAASVGSGVFSGDRPAPLRVFLSASVVHFSGIIAACLIVLAPVPDWRTFGVLIAAGGIFGLIYCGLIWRDMVRDGLSTRIDWDDRLWYVIVPVVGYLLETSDGVALVLQMRGSGTALALAMAVLTLAGIHNAWDITVWIITRRRE
jgi:hypothetical protein